MEEEKQVFLPPLPTNKMQLQEWSVGSYAPEKDLAKMKIAPTNDLYSKHLLVDTRKQPRDYIGLNTLLQKADQRKNPEMQSHLKIEDDGVIVQNDDSVEEEEKYFSFEPSLALREANEDIDITQSLDFFEKIHEINANFQAMERLNRPRKFFLFRLT